MFALLIVPIIGMLGMAGEGSSWFVTQRAAQYTADQAAMAAATNNCAPGAPCATNGVTYVQEAAAVSRRYSFVNGTNNTTVVADIAGTPSPPCGTSTCYRVTIQRNQPILMLRIVGFNGNATTTAGQAATNIAAVAIARRAKSNTEFCITTLSNNVQSFRVDGGPGLDLSSCSVFSPNGGARCSGGSGSQVQGAYVGQTGDSQNCGVEQPTTMAPLDPYAALVSNLPDANSVCPPDANGVRYSTEPKNKNDLPLRAANKLSGSISKSLSQPICGDALLIGNTTFTGNSVLLIENGHLNLNGFTLNTATNASLTIIFSGTAANTYDHFITGSGTADYSAPTSGTWSGVAMYQDPRLTSGVTFTYSGSSPDLNITGLIYAPKADVTIDGAIDHATAGLSCLTFFVNNAIVNGTASIFATPTIDCARAGVDPGGVQTLEKVVMVQ
jgi:hypothetical protein